jgi:hypothetical protein
LPFFSPSDSTEVVTSNRIVIDTSGLLVKQVELEDAGIYTCHAFNMAGSVVVMATVTVYSMYSLYKYNM